MYNGNGHYSRADYQRRIHVLAVFIGFFFLILIARVWYLQILKGSYFKERSEKQRMRIQRVLSPRGEFVDRNGVVLVDTKPGFNVTLVLEDVQNLPETLSRFSSLLGIPSERFFETIKVARENGVRSFQPIRLLSNVDWETVALIEVNQMKLGGIAISPEPLRNYRYAELCSHLFGYMGEINRSELKSDLFKDYRMGDVIGKTGLEKVLEGSLKGMDGVRQVEVNSLGRIIEQVSHQPPAPGNRIVLTIDYDLQKVLEEAFGDASGAGVVLNPTNGEVLALASRPVYDPNLFSGGIAKDEWNELLFDPKHPLTNKAIFGQYPPGSVFKIVVAVAALEEHLVTPQETITCRGYISFGKRRYRCWKRYGHGTVDLHKAMVESCDVYFYEMGQRLGIDKISEYAKNLGLGSVTRINLEGEKAGLIPSREWKRRTLGEPWYPGESLSVAIGQGYNLVTPIQIASLIAAVANGGTIYRPKPIQRIENYQGIALEEFPAEVRFDVPISSKTLNFVQNALEGVVSDKHGTGGRARIRGVRVAGKTGTAQVVRMKQDEEENETLPEKYQDHALFVAFAPVEQPELAMAVLVEHGGHGGATAAPIAQKVMEAYFKKTGRVMELVDGQRRGDDAAGSVAAHPPESQPGDGTAATLR